MGKQVVRASLKQGHPTFVYGRPITPQTSPAKLLIHQEFLAKGLTFLHGELDEHDKLAEAVSRVDIVISTLPGPQVLDQLRIIEAIRVAGNVTRFVPSEFGVEEDRITPPEQFHSFLDLKRCVRRPTEAEGIPYTFVVGNCCAQYFLHVLFHTYDSQADTVIYGTGEAKVVMNFEEDVGTYTVKVADDPRAVKPDSHNQAAKKCHISAGAVSLWERLTGENLKKVHLSQQEIHKLSQTFLNETCVSLYFLDFCGPDTK
uniref:NmrA-like domain-containing protein n=1 Tax=Kalanchoe fedtschenkoi TaxID=63787 RepID=A0A7N0TZC9_KALFE